MQRPASPEQNCANEKPRPGGFRDMPPSVTTAVSPGLDSVTHLPPLATSLRTVAATPIVCALASGAKARPAARAASVARSKARL